MRKILPTARRTITTSAWPVWLGDFCRFLPLCVRPKRSGVRAPDGPAARRSATSSRGGHRARR